MGLLHSMLSSEYAVGGAGFMYESAVLTLAENGYRSLSTPWVALAFAAGIVNNVYCTSMISYRIWESQKLLRELDIGNGARLTVSSLFHPSKALFHLESQRTLHILIESAALITVNSILVEHPKNPLICAFRALLSLALFSICCSSMFTT